MSNPQATKGYTATEALDYAHIVIREADAGRCDTPRAEMLAREVVRLNEWADTWSDAALKERATADAFIKELQAKLSARPEALRSETIEECAKLIRATYWTHVAPKAENATVFDFAVAAENAIRALKTTPSPQLRSQEKTDG